MKWKEKYPKINKPAFDDLLNFFHPDIRGLFLRFDYEMREKFKVNNKYHKFSKTSGWVYGYGRSYNCELLKVTIQNKYFNILGVSVENESTLQEAIAKATEIYNNGFEERYSEICAKRRENQIARAKKRVSREKIEMENLIAYTDPQKLNKFKWCKKVSRHDLYKLYIGESKGLLDEILLEDIGLTFYIRCKQAKEVRECMDKGKIICHNCGAVLHAAHVSPTGSVLVSSSSNALMVCECGHSYTYREYRRSCNAVNMPGGRATPIFENFIHKWPKCNNEKDKMMLIDWLIHECHITLMSGEKGRSVCINLIDGTLKQISDLILKLAYDKNV